MRSTTTLLLFCLAVFSSSANVYTVTDTTTSSITGLANSIAQANSHLGVDTIEFNISGTQGHQIISDSLPDVTDTLFIHGLTQPGSDSIHPSTLPITLIGQKGLTIRSAGCIINGLKIYLTQGTDFCINVEADSAKSVDNTSILHCYVGGNGYGGLRIFPTSNYSLNSSDIVIRNVDGQGKNLFQITATASSDMREITITNCEIEGGDGGLTIDRQYSSILNPLYYIYDNFISGITSLEGYLDSIYMGFNAFHVDLYEFANVSMNGALIEHNEFIRNNGPIDFFYIHDFLNDTITNIRIQNNNIIGGEIHFDFRGNNQVFDSIFFNANQLNSNTVYFEKTNTNNLDSQIINNLIVTNNSNDNFNFPYGLNFSFIGKTLISDLNISDNSLSSWFSHIRLFTDTNSEIRYASIERNTIYNEGENKMIDINTNGPSDSIIIADNSIVHNDPGTFATGINFNGTGTVSRLLINGNNISVNGYHDWSIGSCAIGLGNIHAHGEIKYNILTNCTDAGISKFYFSNDSNTVLEIDSNSINGAFHSGIYIHSSPYNPPQQQIGIYTMLGNSIYNIGKEGIYRFSQHDTASCMTCIPKPQLLYAEYYNGITTVSGTLQGDTFTNYIIELFSNNLPDTGGYTEGQFFAWRDTVVTDATGNAMFSISFTGNYLNTYMTSTATSITSWQTSEFSNESGVVLGMSNMENENEITVFPNPVSRDLFIYTAKETISHADIIDLLGNRTNLEFLDPYSNKINMENFSPGLYFVEIYFDDKTIIKKILKR